MSKDYWQDNDDFERGLSEDEKKKMERIKNFINAEKWRETREYINKLPSKGGD